MVPDEKYVSLQGGFLTRPRFVSSCIKAAITIAHLLFHIRMTMAQAESKSFRVGDFVRADEASDRTGLVMFIPSTGSNILHVRWFVEADWPDRTGFCENISGEHLIRLGRHPQDLTIKGFLWPFGERVPRWQFNYCPRCVFGFHQAEMDFLEAV